MSIQAVSYVLDTDVPEVAAKMLLVCLANAHNNETGLCCPSVERLAEESSMSRRSVQRWLRWLADNGLIDIVETKAESGRQQTNLYRLPGFHRGAKLTPSPQPRGVTGDTLEGVTVDTPEGVTGDTPNKEPEEYRKKEPVCVRVAFDEVWNVYPLRPMSNRSEAVSAYDELTDDETHRVLAAAQRYAQAHLEEAAARKVSPDSLLEFRMGLGKWIRTGEWTVALSMPLKSAAAGDMVVLPKGHPDFDAVQAMRGKPVYVGDSGMATFTIAEVEQARKGRAA